MKIFLATIISYLLGSIPTAYLMCKLLRGIDIRTVGSGNVGATNVARAVGKGAGIATLVLDILKGSIAVVCIPLIVGSRSDLVKIVCAIGVVCGHNWTIFLKFKGGKGVASTAGALIGLMPVVFLSGFCVWGIVFTIWRYVSLASIAAAVSVPVFLFFYKEPLMYQVLGLAISIITIVRHKENIKRLLKRQEKKFR